MTREEQLMHDLTKPLYVLRMALPAARSGATPQMRKSGRTRAINARKQIHDITLTYAEDYGYGPLECVPANALRFEN